MATFITTTNVSTMMITTASRVIFFRLMSAEDQQLTCENTARAMGDAELFIKQRHVRNCYKADPAYGTGVAKALGIDLDEALKATR